MSTVARESRFVVRVRAEMTRQSLSVRGLARKMDPANVDRARRNLHRWLDEGITPGRASRLMLAAALGVTVEELFDPDDAEAARVAPAAAGSLLNLEALDALLMERIGAAVEKALADAKARQ